MMHDCRGHFDSFPDGLEESLYADDTLLIGKDPKLIQRYMNVIAEEGKRYGLHLNMSKLEMIQINCDVRICDPDGQPIKKKDSMKYLRHYCTRMAESTRSYIVGWVWHEQNLLN